MFLCEVLAMLGGVAPPPPRPAGTVGRDAPPYLPLARLPRARLGRRPLPGRCGRRGRPVARNSTAPGRPTTGRAGAEPRRAGAAPDDAAAAGRPALHGGHPGR